MKTTLVISILINVYLTIALIYIYHILRNDIKRSEQDHETRISLLNEYTDTWKSSYDEMNKKWQQAYEEMNSNWKNFYEKH